MQVLIDYDESKNLPKMTLSDEHVTPELEYEILGFSKTFETHAGQYSHNVLSPAKLIIRVVSNEECQGQFRAGMLDAKINVCAKINDPGQTIPEVITSAGLIILIIVYKKAIYEK